MQCGPSTCICENGTYLKSIVDTLIIVYIEVINTANTIPRNVMSTGCHFYYHCYYYFTIHWVKKEYMLLYNVN